MDWINRIFSKGTSKNNKKANIPEGLWTKCTNCQQVIYKEELLKNLLVCPKCQNHMEWDARSRILYLLDNKSTEILPDLTPQDPLRFKDSKRYKERLSQAQKTTKEKEALIAFKGKIAGMPVVICALNFSFMGGSMGSVVGAKFTKACEEAIKLNCPFVCFSASGGARMQEGLISLMQMAKTSAVLAKLQTKKLPYISILTNPTFGGVSASFAMLGDIILAEPNALIGFAGSRVIEQTVREKLPEGFQRAEFLMEKGMIDKIVERKDLYSTLAELIAKLTNQPSPTVVK